MADVEMTVKKIYLQFKRKTDPIRAARAALMACLEQECIVIYEIIGKSDRPYSHTPAHGPIEIDCKDVMADLLKKIRNQKRGD